MPQTTITKAGLTGRGIEKGATTGGGNPGGGKGAAAGDVKAQTFGTGKPIDAVTNKATQEQSAALVAKLINPATTTIRSGSTPSVSSLVRSATTALEAELLKTPPAGAKPPSDVLSSPAATKAVTELMAAKLVGDKVAVAAASKAIRTELSAPLVATARRAGVVGTIVLLALALAASL